MDIDSPISEIAKLAKNKGFKAKTVSTIHTFEYFTNNGKNFKINDTCLFLLACEIQKWLRFNLRHHHLLQHHLQLN